MDNYDLHEAFFLNREIYDRLVRGLDPSVGTYISNIVKSINLEKYFSLLPRIVEKSLNTTF